MANRRSDRVLKSHLHWSLKESVPARLTGISHPACFCLHIGSLVRLDALPDRRSRFWAACFGKPLHSGNSGFM